MRVGSFTFDGREYSIHAHVVSKNSAEAAELLWFRERLRADAGLRDEYVAEKRRILAAGVTDQVDYCVSKGTFVEKALASRARVSAMRTTSLYPGGQLPKCSQR